jgi:hypothetical protein
MKRYEPSIPRVALGATAIAMVVVTMVAMVVAPAVLDVENGEPALLSRAALPSPFTMAIGVVADDALGAARRTEHAIRLRRNHAQDT